MINIEISENSKVTTVVSRFVGIPFNKYYPGYTNNAGGKKLIYEIWHQLTRCALAIRCSFQVCCKHFYKPNITCTLRTKGDPLTSGYNYTVESDKGSEAAAAVISAKEEGEKPWTQD